MVEHDLVDIMGGYDGLLIPRAPGCSCDVKNRKDNQISLEAILFRVSPAVDDGISKMLGRVRHFLRHVSRFESSGKVASALLSISRIPSCQRRSHHLQASEKTL